MEAIREDLEARSRELAEAREQQTATSEILRLMNRASATAQPVFDTIATAAMRLCGATSANVFTFDGKLLHMAALRRASSGARDAPDLHDDFRKRFPQPPGRGMAAPRAVLTRSVVVIPDVLADPEYAYKDTALADGFHSLLAVPLLREGLPIGAIAVGRAVSGAFPESHIALLQTFADQAVIAIENERLFNALEARNRALTDALEQQTATSEILRVISQSPTDVQPVFDTIVAAALKLCAATSSNVVTFDGELIHVAAFATMSPEGSAAAHRHFSTYPKRPSRDTANTRAILTRSVVSIPDVLQDADYAAGATASAAGYRSVVRTPPRCL